MKTLNLVEHLSLDEIISRKQKQTIPRFFLRWQIMAAVAANPGVRAQSLAQPFLVSIPQIYKIVQRYNKEGPDCCENKTWGGRRESRSFLSLDDEKKLLDELTERAARGRIWTAHDIKNFVEKKVGHNVSNDYIWNLFARHGWKKKVPRPKHPKSSVQEQEDHKKNSRSCWIPAS